MSDLIIGNSKSDRWYTPSGLYKRVGTFYSHNWVDLAADREAIDHRLPFDRPNWYTDHTGLKDRYDDLVSWQIVHPDAGMFCNPPGGSDRLLKYRMFHDATERAADDGRDLLWLVYNINSIQPMVKRFPIMQRANLLIFKSRLEFEGNQGTGNFFGSALLHFPAEPTEGTDRFKRLFNHYGNIYQGT